MVGIGRRDYRRYYEDETEISMEEQLRLDDHEHDHGRSDTPTSTTTFSQPTVVLAHSQTKKHGAEGGGGGGGGGRNQFCWKGRIQLVCLSLAVLLAGFTIGFSIGVHERGRGASSSTSLHQQNHHHSSTMTKSYNPISNLQSDGSSSVEDEQEETEPQRRRDHQRLNSNEEKISPDYFQTSAGGNGVQNSPPQDQNEPSQQPQQHKLFIQLSADSIRRNLRRMTQEPHSAGSLEGKSMAMAIRDLWRSFGLSVRVEQHKALLTTSKGVNLVEILDRNGSVLFTSSSSLSRDGGSDGASSSASSSSSSSSSATRPTITTNTGFTNFRPVIAFSPAANLNGTLIYGFYGRPEDFLFLRRSSILLNGSIALIRFSRIHPSIVSAVASSYGIKGLIFYPDPKDMGPLFPSDAVRWSSLASLENIHDVQKHRGKFLLPAHSISYSDAEQLLRWIRQGRGSRRAPQEWQGALKTSYYLGSVFQGSFSSLPFSVRLRTFNEIKTSSIFNVVAAIPGAWESDRYVVIGCSHDSWAYGAGDPGIGLAVLTEIAEKFSQAVQKGWRPRRSILFISWDANLYASAGVSHWLQEHHFEISTRAIAYVDLSRILQGNQTLNVYSSPLLREIARRAVQRVKHAELLDPDPDSSSKGKSTSTASPIHFSSIVRPDEPSFAFFGNLGIPFIRICVSNSPKGDDYPLFHTSFDTYENFAKLVDPTLKGAETLGKIISEAIVLLADSAVLPINVEDYVVEIQEAFGSFMTHYQDDLHRANLSIAYLQAAVMRLEVIGDNFHTDMHNRSVINPEHEIVPSPSPSHIFKLKKPLLHRIMNDKLMQMDRTFLSRSSEPYKHQILGFTSTSVEDIPLLSSGGTSSDLYLANNMSMSLQLYFPKLRQALDCGRWAREREEDQEDLRMGQIPRDFGNEPNLPNSKINYYALNDGDLSESSSFTDQVGQGRTTTHGRMLPKRNGNSQRYNFLLNYKTAFVSDAASLCRDWRYTAAQKIASLTRALDATSAVLQSPLLPEESE